MRIMRALFIPLAIFIANTATLSQVVTPVPKRDPQAVVILQRSLATMGGVAAAGVQDTVVQITASALSPDGTVSSTATIKTLGPDMIRSETSVQGITSTSVQNGGRAFRAKDGQLAPAINPNARNKRVDHLPVLLVGYEFARQDFSVEYVGLEKIGGGSAHHLRLGRASNLGSELDEKLTKDSEYNLYIDEQTLLVVKASYMLLSETDWRRGLPVEIDFSDYRSIGGMAIPFAQKYYFNGSLVSDVKVTSVATNVGLTATEFGGR